MRVTKSPDERRAELVAAARALFDEKGVEKTRVSDIVRRVGVAQGVFYYYFASKEAMVEVVVAQVGQETRADADAILADEGRPFCGKVALFIEMLLDLVDKFTGDDETRLPAGIGRDNVVRATTGTLMKSLRALVAQGVESGDVTAAHPWEATEVLLYGLRAMGEKRLPQRELIYALTEQALGLPRGGLMAYLPKEAG